VLRAVARARRGQFDVDLALGHGADEPGADRGVGVVHARQVGEQRDDLLRLGTGVFEAAPLRRLEGDGELGRIRVRHEASADEGEEHERADERRGRDRERRLPAPERPADHDAVTVRLTVEPPVEAPDRPGQRAPALRAGVRVDAPPRREHRRQREGDEERDHDGPGDGEPELEEEPSDDPAHEGDGHEDGDDRERRRENGEHDLAGAPRGRGEVVLAHLAVPRDVLDHDDRVIDQDPDREREPEQRDHVQREAERGLQDEGGDDRDRERERGDHRRLPVVQEEHDDDDRQDRTQDHLADHVPDRLADRDRVVADDLDVDTGREGSPELFDRGVDLVRDLDGVRARDLEDVERDGALAVHERERPLLGGPLLDARDVTEPNRLAPTVRDDDVLEVPDLGDPAGHADELLRAAALEPPGRDLHVLTLERADDLGDRYADRVHAVREQVDPYLALEPARDPDLADAGDRFQAPTDRLIGECRQLDGREHVRREREREDRHRGRVELLHDRRLDVEGQVAADRFDLRADVLCRGVVVTAELELDYDERDAFERDGRDLVHTLDGVERLLQTTRDLALDRLRARARVDRLDRDERDVDVRELVDREAPEAEEPQDDEPEHDHRREDGSSDRDPAQPSAFLQRHSHAQLSSPVAAGTGAGAASAPRIRTRVPGAIVPAGVAMTCSPSERPETTATIPAARSRGPRTTARRTTSPSSIART